MSGALDCAAKAGLWADALAIAAVQGKETMVRGEGRSQLSSGAES